MSTGLVGTIGSIATGQLQQTRTAETDRATQELSNQARHADSNRRATDAAGIGQTEREGETSERDADGRRLWERSGKSKKDAQPTSTDDALPENHSKDPTGESGCQLDLSG